MIHFIYHFIFVSDVFSRRFLVTEINMAEYGSCFKQREVLVDELHRNSGERAPLEEVDRPSQYSAILIPVPRGRR